MFLTSFFKQCFFSVLVISFTIYYYDFVIFFILGSYKMYFIFLEQIRDVTFYSKYIIELGRKVTGLLINLQLIM